MLSARYLANLSDDLVELYSKLEYDIKKDIFKRLNKLQQVTDQSVYQMEIVQQVGGLKNDIQQLIAQYDQKAKVEVQKLYEEAMIKATKSDLRYYPTAKRELSENQTQVVNAAIDRLLEPERINKTYASQSRKYEEIYSSLTRMTATVADATEQSFIKEANNAYMKVSTGAFSWQDAYTTAVKNLANEGVKTVLYTGSGKIVERSIESATRMNILTGINQNASQQTLENAENLGTDLVEVSAHLGARPEHAEWQGQVFCLSGEREFVDGDGRRRIAKDFYKTCRLGEAAGICGINCRHSFYPYFEGMPLEYSKGELSEMKDNKVTLDGKKVTQYEAEQELRLCERNIRHYKSEILGYQETNTADTPQYAQAKIKLGQWQARARKITDDTGIQRHYINEYVGSKDGKQPRGSNVLISGGRTYIVDYKIDTQDVIKAKNYYEEIYNRKGKGDVKIISKKNNLEEKDVLAVRNHIFNGKFDPDKSIADSWQRLTLGTANDIDILLFNHELEEQKLINQGMNYKEAHLNADLKYPWEYKINSKWKDKDNDSILSDIKRRLDLYLRNR